MSQDFLRSMIENSIKNTNIPLDNDKKDSFIEYSKNEIIKQILSEQAKIISEKQDLIYKEKKEQWEKEVLAEKLKNAKEVAMVAVFIGFLVGLLVNQVTEIMLWSKSFVGDSAICTGIFIIIILIIINFLYKHWCVDKIENLLHRGDKEK